MLSKRRSILLIVIVYATMTLFGFIENIKGVSFPLIKAEFGAAYDEQGGLVSATWFGYVLFCLAAGFFLSRFGTKKAVVSGYILVGAGALAALAMPTFWTAALALLVVNAGFGFFEVGTNALATQVFTSKTALLMNLMHFFYGLGAVLGPKAAGLLTDSFDLGWRQVYIVALIPVGIVAAAALSTRFPKHEHESTPEGQAASAEAPGTVPAAGDAPATGDASAAGAAARAPRFIDALRHPLVWTFSLTLGFMEVIEFGASNWGGLHLKDVYGLDPRTAGASFVSMFYILFTLSRLFGGFAVEKIGYMRSLFGAAAASTLIYVVGFGLGSYGIWVLPVTGLFIGIMWPTIMAVAMGAFGKDAPVMTSAIIVISGAINGVFQLGIGFTNRYLGEAWGYRSCLVYAIVVLASLWKLRGELKRLGPNR
jgi:fucose permease